MRVKDFAAFIKAREAHRLGRGKNPIIAQFRFCNVRREDDRVTRWISDNIRTPLAANHNVWFALTVARLFNLPESLALITPYLVPWKPEKVRKILHDHKDRGGKVFNAAYIVSTNGLSMDKIDYVLDRVLFSIWGKRQNITMAMRGATLAQIHELLQAQNGLGSFMAAQVVADLKYAPPYFEATLGLPTTAASDWWTFAAQGPGSKRGLNRVMGRAADAPYRVPAWKADIEALHKAVLPHLPAMIGAGLHCQDIQNCLCEFDKYERARTGEGRPKQLYTPHKEK